MFDIALRKRIMDLYKNDSATANKLLAGDVETIRYMLRDCEITDEMVIYAYEHNKMEELYEEAKRHIEIDNLYHDLCIALASQHDEKSK